MSELSPNSPVIAPVTGWIDPHRRLRQKAAEVMRTPGAVPSPCVSICQMDATSGWCKGCLRTLDEIVVWSRCSDADKRQIWQSLSDRKLPYGILEGALK